MAAIINHNFLIWSTQCCVVLSCDCQVTMWWACLSFVVHALVRVVGVVVCCQLAARLDVCVHFALQLESEIINTQQNRQDLQQQCQDLSKVRREGGRSF